MQAVVLAAGEGKRLGELTREIPKPMLVVGGKPVLEHNLDLLKHAGVREVFMTELLVPFIGNENAILIAIISRIWWTLIESIFIVLSSGKMFSEFIKTSALPEIIN